MLRESILLEMPGVVVTADDPAITEDDQPGDRRVVRRREGERGRSGRFGECRPDRSPVADDHDSFTRVPEVESRQGRADTTPQRCRSFGSGNGTPILCRVHLGECRVGFGGHLPEVPTLPLPQMHLAQIGFDTDLEAKSFCERIRSLDGTAKRGGVDRSYFQFGESGGNLPGLLMAQIGERWITLPVNEHERRRLDERGGLPVSHEDDLRRGRRHRPRALAEFPVVGGISVDRRSRSVAWMLDRFD